MSETAPVLIACLCAEWCSACRAYRAVFEEVAGMHSGSRFLWVDIEDAAELFDNVDFEVFPAVLIADGERPVFFGPVAPQREVLGRLVAMQRASGSGTAPEGMDLAGLLKRLQAVASGESSIYGIQRVAGRRGERAP